MKNKIISLVNRYRRQNKFLDRWLKFFIKWMNVKQTGHPTWSKTLNASRAMWDSFLIESKNGSKILIGTSIGQYFAGTNLESVLAVALTLRGADVHVLLCDSFLPACFACDVSWYPNRKTFVKYGPSKDLCKHCFAPANKLYKSLGVTVHKYGDLVTTEEQQWADHLSTTIAVNEIAGYTFEGCSVGEHAIAGTLRFYARGTLSGEPDTEPVLRRFFKSALLSTMAVQRLLKKVDFQAAVFHHGIYVPQGLIGEVARKENVRVVNWNPAYRKKRFIFSHQDTYHHTLMSEPVKDWEDIRWNPEVESDLLDYLKSRWEGSQDWIWFHEHPYFDLGKITEEIGVDFSKPCIGMLTNVLWDAQLHYPANAFPNMLDWVMKTIEYFEERPDLNLLIRVHPAEIRGTVPSRQTIVEEIKERFPNLPKNVFVIPPQSHISTYAAMSTCDSVIIFGTKMGVELTSIGIPVIVAGEAWVRNKGITLDASSVDGYLGLLDQLPLNKRLDEEKIKRARKYAYHFFFRRMIPLEFFEPTGRSSPYRVTVKNISELIPGQSIGLDIICNGILNNTPFIYPAEDFVSS
ncbi:capsule biosynthesis protein [Candidatus Villigracilis vicinus]|uniref:capsular polysaccharide export protein, LipB/KpsS family n=1 Tax=Candidatus Villigracilis vicinus TaxID=3140679 RepID=UPI0031F02F93